MPGHKRTLLAVHEHSQCPVHLRHRLAGLLRLQCSRAVDEVFSKLLWEEIRLNELQQVLRVVAFLTSFVELLPQSAQACGGGTGSGLGCLMLERLALPSQQDAESSPLRFYGSGCRCSTEAPFRGLREEEQDLLHGLVLPSGCHGRCRALQHRAWVLIHDSGVCGLVTKPPSGLVFCALRYQ